MLVLPADAKELEQTLAFTRGANTPLITTSGVDPRYLTELLGGLAKDDEVDVFTLDLSMGLMQRRGEDRWRPHTEGGSIEVLFEGLELFAAHIEASYKRAVLLLDLSPRLFDIPEVPARIDAFAARIYRQASHARVLTPAFESPWTTSLDLSPPTGQELTRYVDRVVASFSFRLTDQERRSIIEALRGLVAPDIHQILESASYHSEQSPQQNASGHADGLLERVERARRERLVTRVGLEVVPRNSMDQMGGMEVLKRHLEYDAAIFQRREEAIEQQLALPKGILLVGLPGCGKSLAAKVSASVLDLPLLRLDVGSLMGKYLGESEERMRRALDSVEASAPCVLWIDELEKALGGSTGGEGTGTDTRMLGLLLTWMQENDLGVYVVATANSVEKLPPELLRRGRFDESFFVGLPNEREREAILKIHLRKRNLTLEGGVEVVAGDVTEGFSGAEIEALVKAAHRQRFVLRAQTELLDDLVRLAGRMTPFSKQWEQQREKMERPIREQGFKNASLTGVEHELPPVPKEHVPRALQALLDAPGSVVLRPRDGTEWTMELVVVQERIELRLCRGDRAHVGPGDADALTTLRASDGVLMGRLSAPFEFSYDTPAAQEVALESVEHGDVCARFADRKAIVLDIEFLAPVATGSRGISEEFPPALYGCLGGAFELELGHRKISFINSGARREAVITTKQGDEKRFRVRAQGSSVLLGSLDGESDETMELVWNGEQVQLGQSSWDGDEAKDEAREVGDHPVGFRGTFQTGGFLKISPKEKQVYKFSFTNPHGLEKIVVYLSLEAGRYKGVVRLGGKDQAIRGGVKAGALHFAFSIGQNKDTDKLSCTIRSQRWEVTVHRKSHPTVTTPIEELAVMGKGITVLLVSAGQKPTEVIETLHKAFGLSFGDAMHMVENCPVEAKTRLTPSEASKLARKLRQAGAKATII